MTVKVTLEFESVDAAIVGLGKFVGAPLAPKQPRKGRDDKGQKREPYGPREDRAMIARIREKNGESVTGVTAPGNEQVGATPTATVPVSDANGPTEVKPVTATITDSPPLKFEQVENVFKAFFNAKGVPPARELFAKFGINRLPELKPEQYAEFVNACSR